MTLHLPVSAQVEKTELLAAALEKLIVARAQIDAFNVMIEAARETVGDACRDYAAAVAKLEHFARQMAEEQTADFAEHSERWRESDAGQRAAEWIGFYRSFKPQVPEIELPAAVDADLLSDDLLSAFEELPDLP